MQEEEVGDVDLKMKMLSQHAKHAVRVALLLWLVKPEVKEINGKSSQVT